MCPLPATVLQNYLQLFFPTPCCVKMEESTPPSSSSLSKSVLVISLVALLVKGGECGELVLPSLPPLVRRTEEREELVCGRVKALTGNRENNPVAAVSVLSMGEEEQGWESGKVWHHDRPIKLDSIWSEPHLEVDTEEEPKTVPIQESRQT